MFALNAYVSIELTEPGKRLIPLTKTKPKPNTNPAHRSSHMLYCPRGVYTKVPVARLNLHFVGFHLLEEDY